MSPNIESMEKEPQENDSCLEDGNKPKVMPLPSKLEYLEDRGFSRRSLLAIGILLLVVLLLFIIVIVLAALPCRPSESSGRPLCDSPDCYRTSANILEQLNTSVDPCVDFYHFACDGWLQHNPIAPKYGAVSVIDNARRQFAEKSREIIEIMPYTADSSSLQWKVKAFYHSCMNVDAVDSAGDAFLKRLINHLKGWKPIQTWMKNSWDWSKVLRDLQVEYGAFPFFTIGVRPDEDNPIQNAIQISPSGLGLPHWSYYFRVSDDKITKAYMQLMKDLAQQLGATSQQSASFADEVFHFERRIAEILKDTPILDKDKDTDKDKREDENRKITIKELRDISQRIIWIDHLKAFLPLAYISENTPVYVTSTRYLSEISTILSTTDMGSLNSYLIWTLVLKYAPYLSKDYRNAFDTYSRVYTGAVEPKPRWEFCIETTDSIFHSALLSLYIEYNLDEETFETAHDVYNSVHSAFIDTLRHVTWMDSATRNLAVDKMRNIKSKTSYTDFRIDDTVLNNYYDKLSVLKTDFSQNIQNGALFRRWQVESAIKVDSRNYLEYELSEVIPYYADLKLITLNPILLQDHLFSTSCPRYLIYGALGSYYGHGLVQGFEEVGKTFDRNGYTPILWDNETMVAFAEHLTCLSKHHEEYGLDVIQLPSFKNKSLANSFADIGGITQAFYAFQKWDWAENDPILPGVDYSPEQLFFISYAQSMCAAARDEDHDNSLQLSTYPPGNVRVTGTLAQVPQFAQAFQCREHTQLNPSKRCRFW